MFVQIHLCRIFSVCPYQLRLILAVGALRLRNLPKYPAHTEPSQEVQLFPAGLLRVVQEDVRVPVFVPEKAVAADKLRGEMRWVPRGQRVRRRFVKRRSDTGGAWDGEQHPDGHEIYPEPIPPDREQPAQVSLQTAAGDLRVAPDGRGIWHCCLNRLQQPRVATARRFAEQISAVKFRRRHSARREQVQLRGGFSFSSSKPAMPHFKAEPGGNGYRIMDKPPFL